MKETLPQALVDTVDYLMTLTREGARPEEAKRRLRILQKRHPDLSLDLLWEEEMYDHSVHYDALLHLTAEGTVSLSFCPDRALPWPMRGVRRWSETDLVRVNNTLLKVDQAVACLDFIWDEAPIISRLVNVCLIQEELEKNPIELSDAELQLAMDAFRRARKLYQAEETYRWMDRHGITQEKLERLVVDEAVVAHLRDRITSDQVEEYFERHRSDFDAAFLARIEFSEEESAHQACERIRLGEENFYAAAENRFLAAATSSGPAAHELFTHTQRKQLASEMGAVVFAATPGDVIGPVRIADNYVLFCILSFTPACLNQATRNAIKKTLFEEWLEERRQAATIEWFWGDAGRTDQAA